MRFARRHDCRRPLTATSCPGSSTCTSTASTGTTRWTTAIRSRRSRRGCRASASPRSVPTTVACSPDALRGVLKQVASLRASRAAGERARAAGAPRKQLHQPGVPRCTAGGVPARSRVRLTRPAQRPRRRLLGATTSSTSSPARGPDVGIVTLAPELPGGTRARSRAGRGGPPRVARSLGRQLRGGDRRDRCRRAARDASLQPHGADDAPRAGPCGRGAGARGSGRGVDLRRLSRALRR